MKQRTVACVQTHDIYNLVRDDAIASFEKLSGSNNVGNLGSKEKSKASNFTLKDGGRGKVTVDGKMPPDSKI